MLYIPEACPTLLRSPRLSPRLRERYNVVKFHIPVPHYHSIASHVSPFRITGSGGGRGTVRALGAGAQRRRQSQIMYEMLYTIRQCRMVNPVYAYPVEHFDKFPPPRSSGATNCAPDVYPAIDYFSSILRSSRTFLLRSCDASLIGRWHLSTGPRRAFWPPIRLAHLLGTRRISSSRG